MSVRTQVVLVILLLLAFFLLVRKVRVKKVDVRYTLPWLFLIAALLFLVCFQGLLDRLTKAMGIMTPVNMVFFFGFVLTLIIIYSLTLSVSKMSNEIRQLAQKVALLEKKEKEQEETESRHLESYPIERETAKKRRKEQERK